jgi:2-keto-4-pentenoate hydratase/2-oxohepta-3-ene-1,7-dioic acid hydratase in catechol pathway
MVGQPRKLHDARTTDLIFDVPQLIAELSGVLPLLPGDTIFTAGTPAVGVVRTPPRFPQPCETSRPGSKASAPYGTASSAGTDHAELMP